MELNEKICGLLKEQQLTPDEISEMLPAYSVYQISQVIIADPRIRQVNDLLHDGKIRFTVN